MNETFFLRQTNNDSMVAIRANCAFIAALLRRRNFSSHPQRGVKLAAKAASKSLISPADTHRLKPKGGKNQTERLNGVVKVAVKREAGEIIIIMS
jgi:hypothetical protein